MKSTEAIRAEIIARLGFLPPFFEPALDNAAVLSSLWEQTRSGYLDNPLPTLFKEKLAALLARYCSVPYCLVCHSASLRPLGMGGDEVMTLLEQPSIDFRELAARAAELDGAPLGDWPAPGSRLEQTILHCLVAIFLYQDTEDCHGRLRRALGAARYDLLVLYLAYNRTALTWAEAHPELSPAADERVRQHLAPLLAETPALGLYFDQYRERVKKQGDRHAYLLSLENKQLSESERRHRARAEAELSERTALLSATDEGIYGVDLEGRCTFVNESGARLLGYTTADLAGQMMHRLIHRRPPRADTGSTDACPILDVMRTGSGLSEARDTFWRRDGSPMLTSYSSSPIFASDQVTGAVVSFRDITEQSRLSDDRNRLATVVENSGDFMCLAEPDGRMIYVNDAGRRMLGLDALGPNQGARIIDYVMEEDRAHFLKQILPTVLEKGVWEGEYRLRHWKSGLPIPVNYNFFTTRDQSTGAVTGVAAVARDLRSRKGAEIERDRILELSLDLITVMDFEGNTRSVNRAVVRMLGYAEKEFLTQRFLDFVHPDDVERTREEMAKLARGHPTFGFENRYRTKDGLYRWLSWNVHPDVSGGACFCIARDVTDQVAAREALVLEKELRERFVATLTHDLRTPLTAAKMSAQLVLRRPDRPDSVQLNAGRIVNHVNRIDRMIQDLLDSSRVRAGEGLIIETSETCLSDLAAEVLDEMTTVYGDRFVLDCPDTVTGRWNGPALRRVIENLVNNAVKYGSDGAEVRVSVHRHGDAARLGVHNRGNPLSAQERETIFRPYHRSLGAEAGEVKGWGLGLTLVQGVTHALGGRVRVESSPEAGTNFYVELPGCLAAT